MGQTSFGSGFHPASGEWKIYVQAVEDDDERLIVLGSGLTKTEAVEDTVRELEAAIVALKASVLN